MANYFRFVSCPQGWLLFRGMELWCSVPSIQQGMEVIQEIRDHWQGRWPWKMKIAVISKIDEIGETVGPVVGEYVIVPDHFPDEVTVKVTRRGNFALLGAEEFRVWPEATPVEAWAEYHLS